MAVLVTGGAGFDRHDMVLALLDAVKDVIVLDNLSTGFRRAVPDHAKFVEGDVGDYELVKRLMRDSRIDSVLHFAGSVIVPESSQPLPALLSE